MVDSSPADDSTAGGAAPGRPTWVTASAIVAVVVIVLLGVMLLSGHGPGRHMSGNGHSAAGHTP